METHSDTNYPLAEEQIAEALTESFCSTEEHNLCILRINNEDHPHLNYERIAQRIQDNMKEDISWREMLKEEVAITNGEDIEQDHIIVFRRDELKIEESDDDGG